MLLRLRASDPMAEIDIPHFCAESGHTLVSSVPEDGGRIYLIRRGHDTDSATPKIQPSSDRA
jgi:tRNA 2-thiouridine synthesizing protein A